MTQTEKRPFQIAQAAEKCVQTSGERPGADLSIRPLSYRPQTPLSKNSYRTGKNNEYSAPIHLSVKMGMSGSYHSFVSRRLDDFSSSSILLSRA